MTSKENDSTGQRGAAGGNPGLDHESRSYAWPLAFLWEQLHRPALPWLVLVAIALVLTLSISPIHHWDGDGELYLLNALNILHHHDYAATGYLVNPYDAIHPAAYPPGLPLLLVPVLEFFGISYPATKVMLVLCYIVTLIVIMKITEPFLETPWRIFILLALGINPLIFGFKNAVFSELPFMMFVYFALYTFDRLSQTLEKGESRVTSSLWAGTSGLAMAAAYETRTIGIVLFATVGICIILNVRRFRIFGPAVLLAGIAMSVVISRLFPADIGTYASYFELDSLRDIGLLAHNVIDASLAYVGGFTDLLGMSGYPVSRTGNHKVIIIAYAIIALAATGLWLRLRRGITVYEVFFIVYFAVLCVYPIYGESQRYALPIFPLLVIYAVVAVAQDWPWRPGVLRYRGLLLVAAFVFLYSWQYASAPGKRLPTSVDGLEAQALYEQIKAHVPPDEVILCAKPTIIALHTRRSATNWQRNPETSEFLQYAEEVQAKWLVVTGFTSPAFTLVDLLPTINHRIEAVWSSPQFTLYRMNTEGLKE